MSLGGEGEGVGVFVPEENWDMKEKTRDPTAGEEWSARLRKRSQSRPAGLGEKEKEGPEAIIGPSQAHTTKKSSMAINTIVQSQGKVAWRQMCPQDRQGWGGERRRGEEDLMVAAVVVYLWYGFAWRHG